MDSDRGKKMEQRCHFKITGSGSGFHYFLWQGASKKKNPVDEFCVFFFYSQWKPQGTGLPILPSWGTWEPVLWRTQERAGWPEGSKAPSKQREWRRHGGKGHSVFSTQILWSFCQTGVYKAKTSRAFSYFLAYSPGVHLNRNQLLAFSLLQHVAGENLASGLAIIKNKNILLPWENSTTGKKRTEIFAFRIPELVWVQYLLSPLPAPIPGFHFEISPCICHSHRGLLLLKQRERNFSFHWEARIAGVIQILPSSFSVIKLYYQRKKIIFFYNCGNEKVNKTGTAWVFRLQLSCCFHLLLFFF